MRIAWILYGSLDQRTGGTIYDARIVDGLRRHGDEVEVLSIERPRRWEPAHRAAEIVRRLARSCPDVVVGDELCFRELSFVFPRVTCTRRVLLVHHLTCWEHEPPASERRRARVLEAKAIRSADRVIVTSRATRARLLDEGCRRPIDVAPPGADRLELVPRATRDERAGVTFLFVGAIIPRKRVRELVAALSRAGEGCSLRLAGSRARDARHAREVERLVAELGLGDRVAFLDEPSDGALSRELAAADALVMPSSLEGYGIAATEALRAGTPVIAARGPGLEEALAPCPGGRLLFDGEEGLASAMRAFATDRALRGSMLDAASRTRMPSWSEAVAAFRAALSG